MRTTDNRSEVLSYDRKHKTESSSTTAIPLALTLSGHRRFPPYQTMLCLLPPSLVGTHRQPAGYL